MSLGVALWPGHNLLGCRRVDFMSDAALWFAADPGKTQPRSQDGTTARPVAGKPDQRLT